MPSSGARRRTFRPPSRTPSLRLPRSTQSCITAQRSSSPARTCAADRQLSSLASITWSMGNPVAAHAASRSPAVWNG